jgi:cytoskeletal protein CcmA (bactofilin family)
MWKRDASPRPASVPTAPTAEPPPRPAMAPSALKSVETQPAENVVMNLGKSVMIKGELNASEDLTLCGQMEGRIAVLDHTLTVGPDANIHAEIRASTVVIMGAVSGNITATTRVDIQSTGSVIGDIISPRIAIAEGGQLLGKVQMTDDKTRARRTA